MLAINTKSSIIEKIKIGKSCINLGKCNFIVENDSVKLNKILMLDYINNLNRDKDIRVELINNEYVKLLHIKCRDTKELEFYSTLSGWSTFDNIQKLHAIYLDKLRISAEENYNNVENYTYCNEGLRYARMMNQPIFMRYMYSDLNSLAIKQNEDGTTDILIECIYSRPMFKAKGYLINILSAERIIGNTLANISFIHYKLKQFSYDLINKFTKIKYIDLYKTRLTEKIKSKCSYGFVDYIYEKYNYNISIDDYNKVLEYTYKYNNFIDRIMYIYYSQLTHVIDENKTKSLFNSLFTALYGQNHAITKPIKPAFKTKFIDLDADIDSMEFPEILVTMIKTLMELIRLGVYQIDEMFIRPILNNMYKLIYVLVYLIFGSFDLLRTQNLSYRNLRLNVLNRVTSSIEYDKRSIVNLCISSDTLKINNILSKRVAIIETPDIEILKKIEISLVNTNNADKYKLNFLDLSRISDIKRLFMGFSADSPLVISDDLVAFITNEHDIYRIILRFNEVHDEYQNIITDSELESYKITKK